VDVMRASYEAERCRLAGILSGRQADHRGMSLSVTTDHLEIAKVLDEAIAADPVRGTTLGTIRGTLTETAWLAYDGERLAVRSAAAFPLLVSGRWSPAERRDLAALLTHLPELRGVVGPADEAEAIVGVLPAGRTRRIGQRLFRLDELTPPPAVPGSPLRADARHRDLVRAWYRAFTDEVEGGMPQNDAIADGALDAGGCWLWLDGAGRPASLANRRPVLAGSSRIGPVYTPPEQRGRGYGSAVTAAASRDILDDGAVPVLFTDLANPTSNKIYQLLGYRPVEDRLLVLFD
jgi:predicted GNAT family acetyltransferase